VDLFFKKHAPQWIEICCHEGTSQNIMKNAIAIFAVIPVLLISCTREIKLDTSDVPSEVIESFNAKYPAASEVKWVAEEEGGFYFEAKFKMDGKDKEVHFKTDGTFVEEEK
jgi:hypothetical protein